MIVARSSRNELRARERDDRAGLRCDMLLSIDGEWARLLDRDRREACDPTKSEGGLMYSFRMISSRPLRSGTSIFETLSVSSASSIFSS